LRGCVSGDEATKVLAREPLPLQLSDNGIIHPQQHTLTGCPEIHVYHLMPRGTSKGRAVAADMARRRLRCEQAVAVGDAAGDVGMGAHAGCFVLVGNAAKTAVLASAAAAAQVEQAQVAVAAQLKQNQATAAAQVQTTAQAAQAAQNQATVQSQRAAAFALPEVVFATTGRTADGWVEFADALLAAQAG
jgi:hypothetical protein